jgi:N-acyl-D-aspartate/D-glutamate deacylase
VKGGLIAAIGEVSGDAEEIIDAAGMVVSPGFVDIHTHLDAQIGWDPDMTPVSWHGVTTALIGNCGMTFAPCKPGDHELLAGMMETVEDIPKEAILSGLDWNWEQYGEYLESIDQLGTAVNVAGLVGHAAVRYYVMGDRSFEDDATPEEEALMISLVESAMESGAFGFSTNRYEPHKAPDGRSIPGTFADVSELKAIAGAVSKRGGLMQAVGADFEALYDIASIDNARVLFSYGTGPEEGNGTMAANHLDKLAEGRDVTAISHVRGSGYMFGLQSGLPFRGDTWNELREMNLDQRKQALKDESKVAALIQEGKASNGSYVPVESVFYLGSTEVPDYTSTINLKELAESRGEHWMETFINLSNETDGRALFNFRMFATSMKEQAALFKSKNIYPGLGDAGAHVSQIMDAGWSSFILSYWMREAGEFTLEEAVQKMTSGPARVVGLTDRGLLKEGLKADINVFDPNTVTELQPVLVNDFPGSAPRYIQRAKGFKATIVNGQISLRDDELTGVRAGKVLRFDT